MDEAGKAEWTKGGSRIGQKDSNKLGTLILSPSTSVESIIIM